MPTTKIVRACRRGDPALTLTGPAKLAAMASRIAPDLFAEVMALTARLLPAATGLEGDARRTGWESFSAWSPSALTKLADDAVATNNERRSSHTQGAADPDERPTDSTHHPEPKEEPQSWLTNCKDATSLS